MELPNTLTVTYNSPTSPHFSHQETLPSLPGPDPLSELPGGGGGDYLNATAAYLSGLRTAVLGAQIRINDELTSRMDEDKRRDAAPELGKSCERAGKRAKIDEEAEEENYGEEIVEEE